MPRRLPPNPDVPHLTGYVATLADAMVIVQGAILGTVRRLDVAGTAKDRYPFVYDGSIVVFDEKESGIKRWTDGYKWSQTRIQGGFMLYREGTVAGIPKTKFTLSTTRVEIIKQFGVPYLKAQLEKIQGPMEDGRVTRSKTRVVPYGYCKRAYTIKFGGRMWHVVNFYTVLEGKLSQPIHGVLGEHLGHLWLCNDTKLMARFEKHFGLVVSSHDDGTHEYVKEEPRKLPKKAKGKKSKPRSRSSSVTPYSPSTSASSVSPYQPPSTVASPELQSHTTTPTFSGSITSWAHSTPPVDPTVYYIEAGPTCSGMPSVHGDLPLTIGYVEPNFDDGTNPMLFYPQLDAAVDTSYEEWMYPQMANLSLGWPEPTV